MITETFSHNINNLQSIRYSYNYALKSALVINYANTQSLTYLNVNDCYGSDLNVSMNQYESNPYEIYIIPADVCAAMLGHSKN